jgi:hypothetical protein
MPSKTAEVRHQLDGIEVPEGFVVDFLGFQFRGQLGHA